MNVSESVWDTNRVFTVPNVLSFLRLAAIPVFVWFALTGNPTVAVVILMVSGVTDWFDGYLARALNQRTKLGSQLDPITDRLYIIATVITLLWQSLLPLWFVIILLSRDLMLLLLLPFLRRTGRNSLPVTWVGKSGTFALLIALPLLLLGSEQVLAQSAVYWIGWAIALIGCVLYWVAGFQYVAGTRELLRQQQRELLENK